MLKEEQVKEVYPFNTMELPKTLECTYVCTNRLGDLYNETHKDTDKVMWTKTRFYGEYICVEFKCNPTGHEIVMDDFKFNFDVDDVDEMSNNPKDFEILIQELNFVKQVLSQSAYIK